MAGGQFLSGLSNLANHIKPTFVALNIGFPWVCFSNLKSLNWEVGC